MSKSTVKKQLTQAQKDVRNAKARARRAAAKSAKSKLAQPAAQPSTQVQVAGAANVVLHKTRDNYQQFKHTGHYTMLMASLTLAAQIATRAVSVDNNKLKAQTGYRPDALKYLMGGSAFNYWETTKGWLGAKGLTPAGRSESTARLNGERGKKRPNSNLVKAFLKAFTDGQPVDFDMAVTGKPGRVITLGKGKEFKTAA